MPYPPKKDRVDIDAVLSGLRLTEFPRLAYAIVRLCVNCAKARRDGLGVKFNWEERMKFQMVLDDIHEEWFRRLLAPYHDKRCQEEGDIFDDLI